MGGIHTLQALVRRYLLGIWRWRWVVAGVAWLLCLGGWAGVSLIPNQYEANARLYVDADAVLTPLLRGVALDNSPANQLDMLQRTLLSRPNLEKLISKTDLQLRVRTPSDQERLVAGLATAIKITPQTKNLFTISYRSTRPKLAYDVVQTVLSIFVESKAGTNRSDMENARLFLDQQIANYEQKLRAAEAQRAAFTARYLDLLPDANGGASKLDAARAEVANLQETLKQAQLREELAKQQLAATPPTISADADGAAGLAGVPAGPGTPKACQDLEAALARFTDKNPTVITLRAACEEARKHGGGGGVSGAGRSGGHTIPNPVAEKLRLQIFDLEAAIASLQQRIVDRTAARDRLEAIARGAPGIQAQYTDMNRDYEVLRRNYQELIERREAMRIAAAADTDAEKVKLQVVDPPQVPQIPVAPKRMLLISAVLPLGIIGGIAASLLLQQFDTSFHTIEELRALGLPVMGSISLNAARRSLAQHVLPAAGFAAALLLLCAVYGGLVLRLLHRNAA
jgi:polysaccharide chain length determinant protein (PEP-CTERM system associated)